MIDEHSMNWDIFAKIIAKENWKTFTQKKIIIFSQSQMSCIIIVSGK